MLVEVKAAGPVSLGDLDIGDLFITKHSVDQTAVLKVVEVPYRYYSDAAKDGTVTVMYLNAEASEGAVMPYRKTTEVFKVVIESIVLRKV